MTGRHVAIVGGGIAGLSAAIALARAGWQVRLHERSAAFAPAGAALSLWSNALAALATLGLDDAVAAAGAPIRRLVLADQRDRPILRPAPTGRSVMIARAALHDVMLGALDGVELVTDSAVAGLAADGRSLRLADGAAVPTDLVIDAGGIGSPLAVPVTSAANYCGYGGALALTRPGSGTGDGLVAEWWGRGERFGVCDLPDRRYWFYMRDQPGDAAPPTLADLIARAGDWPAPVGEALGATAADALIPVAIRAKPPPRRLGRGRLLLVGDAAHAMEPNLGQGACQAIEDAAALGRLAGSHDATTLLAAFERVRRRRIRHIVREAARGRHGAHGFPVAQALTRALLRAVPAALSARMVAHVQTLPEMAA